MRLLASTFVTVFFAAASAVAQTTLPYDHVHLAAPDQAKAVEWYQKNFGGQPMTEAPDRLMFGDTRLIFLRSANGNAQPPAFISDSHSTAGRARGAGSRYVSLHDDPERAATEYLPEAMRGRRYYSPSGNGEEAADGDSDRG